MGLCGRQCHEEWGESNAKLVSHLIGLIRAEFLALTTHVIAGIRTLRLCYQPRRTGIDRFVYNSVTWGSEEPI